MKSVTTKARGSACTDQFTTNDPQFVNNMSNKDCIAGLFFAPYLILVNLCFTFTVVLLNVYSLCYLFICLYFK